jgi:hypothetical protein
MVWNNTRPFDGTAQTSADIFYRSEWVALDTAPYSVGGNRFERRNVSNKTAGSFGLETA